ncbi:MAG: acyl-CoA thioesterase [Chlorobi bacterium]|nr:acyl-CoA thioesterase [Chlorobiota bacterium]
MTDRIDVQKRVSDSQVEMTELVLPNDTNQLGNLLGGRLMHWIDVAAALAAMRHTGEVCVTAAIDNMSFHAPINLGSMVILKASVNRAFSTSMEVGVRVEVENPKDGTSFHANTTYLTFVGIDDHNKPLPAPPIIPESQEELRRFESAGVRRQIRLEERNRLNSLHSSRYTSNKEVES